MKHICLWCLTSLWVGSFALAQSGSEIILYDLAITSANVVISNPVNATQHPGYDNQPSFHPQKPFLYYTSFNAEGRAEIIEYHWKKKATRSVTQTSEREYSPTVTPDGQFLSCIIQRDNGAQDLGKYPLAGGKPLVIINDFIVGYHAWVDGQTLLLFVLGEPQTLRWYDLTTQKDTILASHIGRSLHKIPGQNAMSFVHKSSSDRWIIKHLDIQSRKLSDLADTLPGREDICWLPDGRILSSDGSQLYWYDAAFKKWTPIKMPEAVNGITRLAVSSNGKKLAVVVAE
jgi:hypothetical protein